MFYEHMTISLPSVHGGALRDALQTALPAAQSRVQRARDAYLNAANAAWMARVWRTHDRILGTTSHERTASALDRAWCTRSDAEITEIAAQQEVSEAVRVVARVWPQRSPQRGFFTHLRALVRTGIAAPGGTREDVCVHPTALYRVAQAVDPELTLHIPDVGEMVDQSGMFAVRYEVAHALLAQDPELTNLAMSGTITGNALLALPESSLPIWMVDTLRWRLMCFAAAMCKDADVASLANRWRDQLLERWRVDHPARGTDAAAWLVAWSVSDEGLIDGIAPPALMAIPWDTTDERRVRVRAIARLCSTADSARMGSARDTRPGVSAVRLADFVTAPWGEALTRMSGKAWDGLDVCSLNPRSARRELYLAARATAPTDHDPSEEALVRRPSSRVGAWTWRDVVALAARPDLVSEVEALHRSDIDWLSFDAPGEGTLPHLWLAAMALANAASLERWKDAFRVDWRQLDEIIEQLAGDTDGETRSAFDNALVGAGLVGRSAEAYGDTYADTDPFRQGE